MPIAAMPAARKPTTTNPKLHAPFDSQILCSAFCNPFVWLIRFARRGMVFRKSVATFMERRKAAAPLDIGYAGLGSKRRGNGACRDCSNQNPGEDEDVRLLRSRDRRSPPARASHFAHQPPSPKPIAIVIMLVRIANWVIRIVRRLLLAPSIAGPPIFTALDPHPAALKRKSRRQDGVLPGHADRHDRARP